jgi:hypothetical protein
MYSIVVREGLRSLLTWLDRADFPYGKSITLSLLLCKDDTEQIAKQGQAHELSLQTVAVFR